MKPMNPEELERMVHQTLRSLPNRRAPATLEARVLSAIAHRATVAWWHKSFAYWPAWVRATFLAGSGSLAAAAVIAGIYLQSGPDTALYVQFFGPWIETSSRVLAFGRSLGDVAATVFRAIPPWWLYGAAAFLAGLYALLFGLCATAYRTLWAHR
jgi:hypothetical protein